MAIKHDGDPGWVVNVYSTRSERSADLIVVPEWEDAGGAPESGCENPDVISAAQIAAVVSTTVARFGSVKALVSNAVYSLLGPLVPATAAEIERQIGTNLVGPIAVMQAVLQHVPAAGCGRIVNVTSVGGRVVLIIHSIFQSTQFGLEAVREKSDKIRFQAEADPRRIFYERTGVSDEEHKRKMEQQFIYAE